MEAYTYAYIKIAYKLLNQVDSIRQKSVSVEVH